jgi:hypothetical protein
MLNLIPDVSIHLASLVLGPCSGRSCARSPTIRRELTSSQKPGLKGQRNLSLIRWVWPPPVGEVGLNQAASTSQERGPNTVYPPEVVERALLHDIVFQLQRTRISAKAVDVKWILFAN